MAVRTFREIRRYAKAAAETMALRTAEGRNVAALAVEREVLERVGGGSGLDPDRKQEYLAKQFVLACRKRGISTQVIHFCKNGEVR